MDIAPKPPTQIIAGDTVKWQLSLADYPAPDWTVSYSLVKDGSSIAISSAAAGAVHLFTIQAADSAGYVPGTYHFQQSVTDGTDRYTIGTGIIEILPNFAGKADGYDARDWLDIAIDALEASIQGRASKTQLMQSVAGMQVQHMSPTDQVDLLKKLYSRRTARDRKANIKAGKPAGRIIGVRF